MSGLMNRPGSARRTSAWFWWACGLLLLALVGCANRQQGATGGDASKPVSEPGAETLPTSPSGTLPLADIHANPANHVGKAVSGTATVAETVSDRGLWVEADATQVFVVKDEPLVKGPALTVGQKISLQGTVHDTKQMKQVPAATKLDKAAQQMLEGQPAFIVATEIKPSDQ